VILKCKLMGILRALFEKAVFRSFNKETRAKIMDTVQERVEEAAQRAHTQELARQGTKKGAAAAADNAADEAKKSYLEKQMSSQIKVHAPGITERLLRGTAMPAYVVGRHKIGTAVGVAVAGDLTTNGAEYTVATVKGAWDAGAYGAEQIGKGFSSSEETTIIDDALTKADDITGLPIKDTAKMAGIGSNNSSSQDSANEGPSLLGKAFDLVTGNIGAKEIFAAITAALIGSTIMSKTSMLKYGAIAFAGYMAYSAIQQGALDNFTQAAGDQMAALTGPSNGVPLDKPLSLASMATAPLSKPTIRTTNSGFNGPAAGEETVEHTKTPDEQAPELAGPEIG
jgi:hypothetical protein